MIHPSSIVIVSGLPRSGTSLMMQMLHAGGHPILADQLRQPDEDNPKGYFEFAPVARSERDIAWLPFAAGKAVKVVSLLLHSLPPDSAGKIIFMERDLDEILLSQARMLERKGRGGSEPPPEEMKRNFELHLRKVFRRLEQRPAWRVWRVHYGELVRNPAPVAEALVRFLERPLDIPAMIAAVDPTLHRQRNRPPRQDA